VPLGLRATLTDWGVDGARVTELNWGDTHVHRVPRTDVNATILCTPAQHWSQRGLLDRCKVSECSQFKTELIRRTDTLVGLGGAGADPSVLFRR
jgi:L-ascorbate metabolism protein UlaG (beta-lactamase superfamily)